jgi:hypothetical protein
MRRVKVSRKSFVFCACACACEWLDVVLVGLHGSVSISISIEPEPIFSFFPKTPTNELFDSLRLRRDRARTALTHHSESLHVGAFAANRQHAVARARLGARAGATAAPRCSESQARLCDGERAHTRRKKERKKTTKKQKKSDFFSLFSSLVSSTHTKVLRNEWSNGSTPTTLRDWHTPHTPPPALVSFGERDVALPPSLSVNLASHNAPSSLSLQRASCAVLPRAPVRRSPPPTCRRVACRTSPTTVRLQTSIDCASVSSPN